MELVRVLIHLCRKIPTRRDLDGIGAEPTDEEREMCVPAGLAANRSARLLALMLAVRLFDLTMDGILKDYSQLCGTEERYTSNVDRIRASIQAIRAAAEDVL